MGLSRLRSVPALPTCLGSLAVDEAPGVAAEIQHTPSPSKSDAWFWRRTAQDAEKRWLQCRRAEELGVRLYADLKAELHQARQEAAEACAALDVARADLAEGEARYADMLHLVGQVDEEIATRRAAENRAATAEKNELRTAQRCEAAEAQVAEMVPRLAHLEAMLCESQKECTERREAEAALNQRLGEILPEHAKLGIDLQTAAERIDVLEQCLRSSEAQVQNLQEERQRLEGAHCDLEALFQEEQRLRSAAEDQLKVALEEGQSLRSELKDQGQQVAFLQSEADTLHDELRRIEDLLQVSEAEHRRWKNCAAVALKELQEGEAKAVSTFFCKFPASAALVMVFRRLVEMLCPEETLQEALQCRMNLHRPSHISRHELEYFLVECLGLDSSDSSTVGQVLFAVLDLERQGVLETDQLYARLVEPPTMRAIWRANLEEIWPERHAAVNEMGMGNRSPRRAGSPIQKRGNSQGAPAMKSATPTTATPRSNTPSTPTPTPNLSRTPPPRGSTIGARALPPVSDRSKAPLQPNRPPVPYASSNRPSSAQTQRRVQHTGSKDHNSRKASR
eukprot:gnl/MRDRNA2_/MRDRNA2_77400_c0_seq1.p1 gnl/MRDRNA2_/MRDRNA2_77400_c0~~gnl/MRDRNA2_/MRDRNA2_77400_c0_seq1.p1  ORF type:complete len:565 (+),score=116.04 gnl/MRDRNA2_/MRDRNA2_77400_c0_seq1:45-1739(+)